MAANDKQIGGAHYKGVQGFSGMEHWDWCWARNYNQYQYCITKYVDRYREKNGLQDLKKAQHHLEKLIETIEGEQKQIPKMEVKVCRCATSLNCPIHDTPEVPREYVNPDL